MSTQEVNSGILQVYPQDDLWDELAPAEWKGLPKATQGGIHQYLDEAGVHRMATIVPCIVKCAAEVPTKEEAQKIVDMVKALGKPVAFLATLSSLHVPSFPDDKDPTVKEFFEGSFDPSTMTVKTILVIYPAIEETK